ncbi:MAG: ribonuclease H-like domain-containing protein [Paludibacteraceae bacterium]|nr:ribonuclease H-like domain-containing protein [Paludibacteraceae bacterium]
MKLNLTRPLVFFDLETTGVNVGKDRIIEISFVKVYPNGDEDIKTRRINPEMHIPESSSAIHGIKDEDVKECPTFKEIAEQLKNELADCDIAGYNSNKFDVPLLAEEFYRAGVEVDLHDRKFVDVQTIFYKKEPRTLTAAYKFYCDADLIGAHGATADTKATYEVLKAQLDRYSDIENNIDFLSEYTSFTKNVDFAGAMVYNDQHEPVFNFGKHKGKKVTDVLKVEPSYYGWMMQNDFSHDTKAILTKIKDNLKAESAAAKQAANNAPASQESLNALAGKFKK